VRAEIFCVEEGSLEGGLGQLESLLNNREFDFALVSFPPDYNPYSVAEGLKKLMQGKRYVGFSSTLTLYNGNLCSDRFTTLLISFEREGDVDIFHIEDLKQEKAVSELLQILTGREDSLNLVISGFSNGYASNFIESLSRTAQRRKIPISMVGGIQGDDLGRKEFRTYQVLGDKVTEEGLLVVSFRNVEYGLAVSFGFKAIGPEYNVVESVGNIVKRIDEESAYYLFERIVSHLPTNDLSALIYTPIILTSERDGLVEIARTPKRFVFAPGCKGVEFFGPVREGSSFKFSFGTGTFLLEDLRQNIYRLKENLPDKELILSVECLGRTKILNEDIEQEKEIYTSMIKTPLFGFFSLGEIAPNKLFNNIKLYNEVNLLVALKEI
jgi:hypothetical protein